MIFQPKLSPQQNVPVAPTSTPTELVAQGAAIAACTTTSLVTMAPIVNQQQQQQQPAPPPTSSSRDSPVLSTSGINGGGGPSSFGGGGGGGHYHNRREQGGSFRHWGGGGGGGNYSRGGSYDGSSTTNDSQQQQQSKPPVQFAPPGTEIYVRNLPEDIQQEELAEIFSSEFFRLIIFGLVALNLTWRDDIICAWNRFNGCLPATVSLTGFYAVNLFWCFLVFVYMYTILLFPILTVFIPFSSFLPSLLFSTYFYWCIFVYITIFGTDFFAEVGQVVNMTVVARPRLPLKPYPSFAFVQFCDVETAQVALQQRSYTIRDTLAIFAETKVDRRPSGMMMDRPGPHGNDCEEEFCVVFCIF